METDAPSTVASELCVLKFNEVFKDWESRAKSLEEFSSGDHAASLRDVFRDIKPSLLALGSELSVEDPGCCTAPVLLPLFENLFDQFGPQFHKGYKALAAKVCSWMFDGRVVSGISASQAIDSSLFQPRGAHSSSTGPPQLERTAGNALFSQNGPPISPPKSAGDVGVSIPVDRSIEFDMPTGAMASACSEFLQGSAGLSNYHPTVEAPPPKSFYIGSNQTSPDKPSGEAGRVSTAAESGGVGPELLAGVGVADLTSDAGILKLIGSLQSLLGKRSGPDSAPVAGGVQGDSTSLRILKEVEMASRESARHPEPPPDALLHQKALDLAAREAALDAREKVPPPDAPLGALAHVAVHGGSPKLVEAPVRETPCPDPPLAAYAQLRDKARLLAAREAALNAREAGFRPDPPPDAKLQAQQRAIAEKEAALLVRERALHAERQLEESRLEALVSKKLESVLRNGGSPVGSPLGSPVQSPLCSPLGSPLLGPTPLPAGGVAASLASFYLDPAGFSRDAAAGRSRPQLLPSGLGVASAGPQVVLGAGFPSGARVSDVETTALGLLRVSQEAVDQSKVRDEEFISHPKKLKDLGRGHQILLWAFRGMGTFDVKLGAGYHGVELVRFLRNMSQGTERARSRTLGLEGPISCLVALGLASCAVGGRRFEDSFFTSADLCRLTEVDWEDYVTSPEFSLGKKNPAPVLHEVWAFQLGQYIHLFSLVYGSEYKPHLLALAAELLRMNKDEGHDYSLEFVMGAFELILLKFRERVQEELASLAAKIGFSDPRSISCRDLRAAALTEGMWVHPWVLLSPTDPKGFLQSWVIPRLFRKAKSILLSEAHLRLQGKVAKGKFGAGEFGGIPEDSSAPFDRFGQRLDAIDRKLASLDSAPPQKSVKFPLGQELDASELAVRDKVAPRDSKDVLFCWGSWTHRGCSLKRCRFSHESFDLQKRWASLPKVVQYEIYRRGGPKHQRKLSPEDLEKKLLELRSASGGKFGARPKGPGSGRVFDPSTFESDMFGDDLQCLSSDPNPLEVELSSTLAELQAPLGDPREAVPAKDARLPRSSALPVFGKGCLDHEERHVFDFLDSLIEDGIARAGESSRLAKPDDAAWFRGVVRTQLLPIFSNLKIRCCDSADPVSSQCSRCWAQLHEQCLPEHSCSRESLSRRQSLEASARSALGGAIGFAVKLMKDYETPASKSSTKLGDLSKFGGNGTSIAISPAGRLSVGQKFEAVCSTPAEGVFCRFAGVECGDTLSVADHRCLCLAIAAGLNPDSEASWQSVAEDLLQDAAAEAGRFVALYPTWRSDKVHETEAALREFAHDMSKPGHSLSAFALVTLLVSAGHALKVYLLVVGADLSWRWVVLGSADPSARTVFILGQSGHARPLLLDSAGSRVALEAVHSLPRDLVKDLVAGTWRESLAAEEADPSAPTRLVKDLAPCKVCGGPDRFCWPGSSFC